MYFRKVNELYRLNFLSQIVNLLSDLSFKKVFIKVCKMYYCMILDYEENLSRGVGYRNFSYCFIYIAVRQ